MALFSAAISRYSVSLFRFVSLSQPYPSFLVWDFACLLLEISIQLCKYSSLAGDDELNGFGAVARQHQQSGSQEREDKGGWRRIWLIAYWWSDRCFRSQMRTTDYREKTQVCKFREPAINRKIREPKRMLILPYGSSKDNMRSVILDWRKRSSGRSNEGERFAGRYEKGRRPLVSQSKGETRWSLTQTCQLLVRVLQPSHYFTKKVSATEERYLRTVSDRITITQLTPSKNKNIN